MSTTPFPSVMMPEVWFALRGKLTILPQTSTDSPTCQWSLASGAVVGWVVVVVVVVLEVLTWRS